MDTPNHISSIQIPLTQNQFAIVDEIDADLKDLRWQINNGGYAIRSFRKDKKYGKIIMARVILSRMLGRELTSDEYADHKDLNRLNNSRSNLRLASKAENNRNTKLRKDNTSGYKGVKWIANRGKWEAEIHADYHSYFLGHFDTPEEAFEAYKRGAEKYHGEFGSPKHE